jgi:hypothetical protein
VHGISLYLILFFSSFIWTPIAVSLVYAGTFLDWVVRLALLFIILGLINSFLSDGIWGSAPNYHWVALIGQGLLLYMMLFIVQSIVVALVLIAGGFLAGLLAIVVAIFVDGFLAKIVGVFFEGERQSAAEEKQTKVL